MCIYLKKTCIQTQPLESIHLSFPVLGTPRMTLFPKSQAKDNKSNHSYYRVWQWKSIQLHIYTFYKCWQSQRCNNQYFCLSLIHVAYYLVTLRWNNRTYIHNIYNTSKLTEKYRHRKYSSFNMSKTVIDVVLIQDKLNIQTIHYTFRS